MKHVSTFESFLNEAYDGNLKDFQYEFPLRFEEEAGDPIKAILKIAKKGKGYEVRTSAHAINKKGDRTVGEPEMKKVGDAMNLKLVSYEVVRNYQGSPIAITVYEEFEFKGKAEVINEGKMTRDQLEKV
jgi:hypothetical protein